MPSSVVFCIQNTPTSPAAPKPCNKLPSAIKPPPTPVPKVINATLGVSAAGDFLLDQVEAYFKQFAFPTIRNTTKLKLAQLGNSAGVIGAASLALEFK